MATLVLHVDEWITDLLATGTQHDAEQIAEHLRTAVSDIFEHHYGLDSCLYAKNNTVNISLPDNVIRVSEWKERH